MSSNAENDCFNEYLTRHRASNGLLPFWHIDVPVLDYGLLQGLLELALSNGGEKSQTGLFAHALDLWIASEFERAGFVNEGVWPRAEAPRVIDPEILSAVQSKRRRVREAALELVEARGRSSANVMGSAYTKQVDVGMSSWMAGPELLVSTKTMDRAFGKNLANRFEEAYGDAKNLRGRYPLTAHGFFYLAEAGIQTEAQSFAKLVHMLRRLQRRGDVYDACALLLYQRVDASVKVVSVSSMGETGDLSPETFFQTLIGIILGNAPEDTHERARELYPFE